MRYIRCDMCGKIIAPSEAGELKIFAAEKSPIADCYEICPNCIKELNGRIRDIKINFYNKEGTPLE